VKKTGGEGFVWSETSTVKRKGSGAAALLDIATVFTGGNAEQGVGWAPSAKTCKYGDYADKTP